MTLSLNQGGAQRGKEGLSLFSQYNPHGIFIAVEDIGYLMMGVAFLFVAIAFGQRERLEQVIRLLFIASSVLAVGSPILLAPDD